MPKLVADDRLFNLYVVFCHHINKHNGRYICNEPDYFDFLDKVRKTHEEVVRAVTVCAPLTPKGMPYIMLRTGKMAATPSGEFYFTFNGQRFGGGFEDKYIQKPRKIEPKPEEIALKKAKEQQNAEKVAKPKPAPPKWTKAEVLDLLTNQAHIVARMLGTGYDLFEPIHGEWIQRWLTNPKKHKIMIHQAHRNAYKCFNPETKVIMADCTCKKIKDIQIGDYVMGWDSTPRKVLSKHSGIDDMYRVTLNKNGETFECNSEHILTMKWIHGYHEEKEDIIDVSLKNMHNKYGNKIPRRYKLFKPDYSISCKDVYKPKCDAYFLGLWLADGRKDRPSISVNKNDIEIEQYLLDFAKRNGADITFGNMQKNSRDICIVYKHEKKNKIIDYLKELGIYKNKHVPDCLLRMSTDDRLNFLAGYIDGDGHTAQEKNHARYHSVTSSIEIANGICRLSRSLGLNCNVNHSEPYDKRTGKFYKRFDNYISGKVKDIPVKLKRKKINIDRFARTNISQFTIEPIGKSEFVGIEIEGDGRYLLDTFTVVHNSAALRLFTAIYLILFPLKTVIIIRKSEDAVKELVQGVSSILDTPLFHTFVDILYPDIKNKGGFKKTTDTALALNTNLNLSLSGEFQLRALGLGSSLTGKHSTMIITDDICVDSDRASVSEREFTKAKYREMMNILSDGKGFEDSWVLNIGTPWHEEDVFSLMDKGLPPKSDLQIKLENISSKKRTEKQNEAIRKLNMERGKFVYNCYQTGLMTQKDIDWKRQSLNDDVLFAANYMLDLVSDDECPFPRIQNVGKYNKTYFSEAWEVFAALDCSYGGEDGTSLSIGAHNWDANETVVYGKLWEKIAIDENYLEVAEYMYDCGVQTLFLENNADKGLMGQKFRELGFNVVSYHEHTNKHTKIISTIRPYWREKGDTLLPCVQFVTETDEKYLSQIYNYKKGVKHDDAPDNLACLLLRSQFGALSIRIT